ncbi:MAG: FtsQ-type POTRA domain-containing protein [Candidatus Nealsonbacteria bacterium]
MKKYYRKPHQYKKKKSIFRKKFLALLFLILAIAGAIFYGLFFWKVFWVEKVIISGEQKITKEDIGFLVDKELENKALFLATKSIWSVNTNKIKEDILNAFPQIAAAEVRKNFFDAISVQITERVPLALWCEAERCFLLDEDGIIFEDASDDPELVIIKDDNFIEELFLGKAVIKKDALAQILKIESKLIEINILINKALIISDERLNIETKEGWEIYFNLKGNLDWQSKELKLTIEDRISAEKRQELEYIDLRFSRVYYK